MKVFFCTKRFARSFDKLLSKSTKYGCVSSHIFKEFNKKNIGELFNSGFSLNGNNPHARLIKYRIQSCNNTGKSSGFRLIALVNKNKNTVSFLEIYPKTGPLAKSNIDSDERSECVKELKLEAKSLQTVYFRNKTITIK